MAGISVKLPLSLDSQLGPYKLNKTLKDSIKQNFKNLILTNPGERMMDINFGVGLSRYLFENNSSALRQDITAKIHEQSKMYMPFIKIVSIDFKGPNDSVDIDRNSLSMKIKYSIGQLNISDILHITL
jgi:phage baseplate assembly protein W